MNRLNEIRKAAGISREKLSEMTEISVRTIERHEAGGSIDQKILTIYADLFQLPIEFILGERNTLTGRFDAEIRMLDLKDEFRSRFKSYNYETITEGNEYYVIWEKRNGDIVESGAHTEWHSDSLDGQFEIRKPRLLKNPDRNRFEKAYGKMWVINEEDEVFAFFCFGGAALIRRELAEEFFSELFEKGFLVEKKNVLKE